MPVAAEPKRAVPDYDGRGNPDVDADHWALWIPRVLLAPLYLVNEYALRRPIGALMTHAEKEWMGSGEGLFTSGPGHLLVLPILRFDHGVLPHAGVYASYEMRATRLRIDAATWGASWNRAIAVDRYTYDGGDESIEGSIAFERSTDNLFFGIGPDVSDATRSRYGLQRLEGSFTFTRPLLRLTTGARQTWFVGGSCCDDPSLAQEINAGVVAAPPGYPDPYTALFVRAELGLDAATGTFLRIHGAPNGTPDRQAWIGYGADAGVAWDVTGTHRILQLQAAVEFVDPLHGELPFTELARMSDELMPGFVPGWMIGRSTAAAQLGYTWPIWPWFDGRARLAAGNAFDAHLGDLSPTKLRLSADFGFTTNGQRDAGFELLVGIGSETFEQGAAITALRVVVGWSGL